MKSNSKNELVKLISICGQVAEHKSEKFLESGKDEAMILSALSENEQEQLKALLEKLQKIWLSEHADHHRHKKETELV